MNAKKIIITAVAALVIALAPTANAYPGDPMPGCESGPLGALVCDGPIRPNGTWQRCMFNPGYGGMNVCRIVTIETCAPIPGMPPYHIES